jgi:menaquinone-dependent protoporphyrinogen oxidase
MTSVLIVHASRHGATAGIAERIGDVLVNRGLTVFVAPASALSDPATFDAVVVGGAVYAGSWVKEGISYLDRYAFILAQRPTWLFSSGPLKGSTKEPSAPVDEVERALGPSSGPGSGGRRKVEDLAERIHPREHRVFEGAFDPESPPTNLPERIIRLLPGAKGILPAGDFRDWPAIEAWATEIAAALEAGQPAAVG